MVIFRSHRFDSNANRISFHSFHIDFVQQVWIKLNATLWPRTQEDKEQVSTASAITATVNLNQATEMFLLISIQWNTTVLSTQSKISGNIEAYEVTNMELSGDHRSYRGPELSHGHGKQCIRAARSFPARQREIQEQDIVAGTMAGTIRSAPVRRGPTTWDNRLESKHPVRSMYSRFARADARANPKNVATAGLGHRGVHDVND